MGLLNTEKFDLSTLKQQAELKQEKNHYLLFPAISEDVLASKNET